MISHDLRCILVHIQKTGGMSIRRALNMQLWDPHQHRFASEVRTLYGPEVWQHYFKFGFVRNSWDRLVSWWEMIRRNVAEGRPMNGFQRYVTSNAATFEEFIRNCGAETRAVVGELYSRDASMFGYAF
ncbi:MAG: sulfotransferase family 2 domain-containing protein [Steroidobacteraceae bacterium]